ncbi:MAG: alanyl-tRNA editing protein [bacterium]|nr:alanyl-tRNA editing protein [bacterium]
MTKKLYHEDPYLQSFSSQVSERMRYQGRPALILQQSAFYPASGGQPHDTGTLNNVIVLNVLEDEDYGLVHVLEADIEGELVYGRINWERRFDHMQQHSGQHLLSQVFLRLCEAETLSFHLGEEHSTIDIDLANLDWETVSSAEKTGNQVIYENRKILTHSLSKEELAQFPLRKMPSVEEPIRLVEIAQFDYSPCGGTHCSHTGEIGLIKIAKTENYRGGTRVHFLCGRRALCDYQHKSTLVKRLGESLTVGEADILSNILKLQNEGKALRRECKELSGQVLDYEATALLTEREQFDAGHVLEKVFEKRSVKELKLLAAKILNMSPATVILFGEKQDGKASLLFSCSEELPFHMGDLMKTACKLIEGQGGGQANQAQGGGTVPESLEKALKTARKSIL